jgi:hypothetical protein
MVRKPGEDGWMIARTGVPAGTPGSAPEPVARIGLMRRSYANLLHRAARGG